MWGLNGNKQYLMSALTRAKKSLLLLTLQFTRVIEPSNDLSQLVYSSGGNNNQRNKLEHMKLSNIYLYNDE